jgi:phosphate transport system substrate-binding protein
LRALARGVIDIAAVARPLLEVEEQSGLRAVRYGVAPMVFVTSRPGPQEALTLRDVADILEGRRTAWPDRKPIRVVLRPQNDNQVLFLRQYSSVLDRALTAAFIRPELTIAPSQQIALRLLEATEGSFGFAMLNAVLSEQWAVTLLPLNGAAPTVDNVAGGSYSLVRSYYLVLPPKPHPLAEAFVAFTQSPESKRLLRTVGTVPVDHN